MRSIEFPNYLKEIDDEAFGGCELENINIPSSVVSIGYRAFYWNKSLQNIKIPYGIKNIGNEAFAECSSLKCIQITDSATKIGENAFKGCNIKTFQSL